MSRLAFMFSCCVVMATAVLLAGCDNSSKTGSSDSGDDEHDGHTENETHHDPKIEKNLAKLSKADRAAAEKQKKCPVSDQLLGWMGTPFKVSVEGQDVFICCEGCEQDIKDDPAKFLAKLK